MDRDPKIPVIRDSGGRPKDERSIARWWKEANPGPPMVDAAERIWNSPQERARRRANLIFARLHTGRPLSSIYDYGSAFRTPYVADPWGFGWKLPINVVQAVIESIVAKVAKNKPRALILTEGGDWSLERQAKGLTKYLDGLNRSTQLYKKGRRVYRDAGAFGTGIFLPYEDRRKATIGIGRLLNIELCADDIESARGTPQTMYWKRPVYRGVLLDEFGKDPDVRAAIEQAKGYNPAQTDGGIGDGRESEMIPTYEAWHLGGMHCIGIKDATLFQEDWEFDWHPPTLFHWREPDSGIWGIGAAENLLGIQYEITQMLQKFQANMRLAAKLWVFRPPGGPSKAQLTNETMTIIDSETAPTFATPAPMPEQAYRYLWDLYSKAFEIEGVSEMSATGVKPAGLDSAVAQREYNDLQTQRFSTPGQDWEDVHIEIAEKEIAMSKRMLKAGKKIVVKAPDSQTIKEINFESVNMDENRSVVGIFPTSSLPTTPAAKLQTIKEYYESGLIPDRETALSLLDFPDLQAALSLELAAIDDVKRILENIVEHGKYEPPEPYMNLELARRMAQSAYLRARASNVPEKRRDYLLRFIDEVQDTIQDMQGQPAATALPAVPMQQAPQGQLQAPVEQPQPGLPPGMSSAAVPSLLPA